MRNTLTTLLFIFMSALVAFAEGIPNSVGSSKYPITEITGDLVVYPGTNTLYNVTWEQWGTDFEHYSNVTWTVTGGTVIESDKHSIRIEWDDIETGYMNLAGHIQVYEDLNGQETGLDITIVNDAESPSETCDGILGPPLVAVDFGSGVNIGPALPSGTTTYQYTSNCTLNVGQYSVVNNTFSCRYFWHNIFQDHTGNTNGYFLMVNANNSRNVIYKTTVNNLIPSFRYEFSAWVGNLYNTAGAQKPKLKFEIYSNNVLSRAVES